MGFVFERQFFRFDEVADILGVSVSSLKRWASEGKLSTVRTHGNHRRITREALIKFGATPNMT